MKYIKLFESFKEEDIHTICKKYGIYKYIINSDGSINTDGDVYLFNEKLNKLPPLKFRNIGGSFWCDSNRLTSLEGCPKSVSDGFCCYNNQLTSLKGSPKSIGGDFYCYLNRLVSLKGCPESIGKCFSCCDNKLTSLEGCPKLINDDFYCRNNKLTSLKGGPESVGGDFYCNSNKIATFEYLPFLIGGDFYCFGNPIYEIWDLFQDYSKIEFLNDCDAIREPNIIILDRLNFFLEEIGKPTVTKVKGYNCI
jgi:hypothetical protein